LVIALLPTGFRKKEEKLKAVVEIVKRSELNAN
jgi:hypothetical protein